MRRHNFRMPKSEPSFDPRPLNVSSGWYVSVSWSYGQIERVPGFTSEHEAKAWIDAKSKDWLRSRRDVISSRRSNAWSGGRPSKSKAKYGVQFIGYSARVIAREKYGREVDYAMLDFVSGATSMHADGGWVMVPKRTDVEPFLKNRPKLANDLEDRLRQRGGELSQKAVGLPHGAAHARGPRAQQAGKLETRALFAGSQGGTVARAGGNTCAPLSAHVWSLGRVLIDRPAMSAFGQTGY
jgi:hypothetical protein